MQQLQPSFIKEKEKAFSLYLDFVIDGSASMYTIFPAVYYGISHILDALSRYNLYPKLGMTIFRSEKYGQPAEYIEFEKMEFFTDSEAVFMKKLKGIGLSGGGLDARESVHTAIRKSLEKFPPGGRNHAIMVFSDAYGSDDYDDYRDIPLGQAVFFSTEELSEEEYRFCLVREDGHPDEEASPMFVELSALLTPMSSELLEDIVRPLKDLLKGVSGGR